MQTTLHGSAAPRPRTPAFTNAASAEAWDAWFRWRVGEDPRDLTIDSTWERVARALACSRGAASRAKYDSYRTAFTDWRLLPDADVLRNAGTGQPGWTAGTPTATLNLAAFVQSPVTPHAVLDEPGLREAGGLACTLLSDALALADDDSRPFGTIALMGLGDAIAMLGLRYDSSAACALADRVGRIVSDSVHEAAPAPTCATHEIAVALRRQPQLALFANATSDAADPVTDEYVVRWPGQANSERCVAALGPALTLRRERANAGKALPAIDTARTVAPEARARMEAALAPWLDSGRRAGKTPA